MREARSLRRECLTHVERHAGIALLAVPVAPVTLHLAESRRNLVGRGLDLLEAENIRALALDEFLQLRLTSANAVHVPGGDFHRGRRDLKVPGVPEVLEVPEVLGSRFSVLGSAESASSRSYRTQNPRT